MTYIDGFILAVPTANREGFRAMASRVGKIFVEHGALRVVENWGDDVARGEITDFYRAAQAGEDETIVFSFIEWPSKEARDRGNETVAADPRLEPLPGEKDIFDSRRMIYGGFVPVVDERGRDR